MMPVLRSSGFRILRNGIVITSRLALPVNSLPPAKPVAIRRIIIQNPRTNRYSNVIQRRLEGQRRARRPRSQGAVINSGRPLRCEFPWPTILLTTTFTPPILPVARKNCHARDPRIRLEYANKYDSEAFAKKYGRTPYMQTGKEMVLPKPMFEYTC